MVYHDWCDLEDVLRVFIRPKDYFARITERIEFVNGSARRTLEYDVLSPTMGKRTVLMPILCPDRDQVPVGLTVVDAYGVTIPLLGRAEQQRLTADIVQVIRDAGDRDTIDKLSSLLKEHWLLFVPIELDTNRHTIFRVTSEVDFFSRVRGMAPTVRYWLGYKPYVLRFETPHLQLTDDYDLEVEGPPDHYVRYQCYITEVSQQTEFQLVALDGTQLDSKRSAPTTRKSLTAIEAASGGTSPPETRSSSTASLHTSGAPTAFQRSAEALVVFNERPPGTIGSALLFALLILFALIVVLISFTTIVAQPNIASETAVIILTLPGTVALWLRPRGRGGLSIDPPLAARFSFLLVGFASYLAGLTLFLSDIAQARQSARGPQARFLGNINDLPLVIFGRHIELGGHLVTGTTIIWAILIAVVLAILLLAWRLTMSFMNYNRSRFYSGQPRPLPKRLLKPTIARLTDSER